MCPPESELALLADGELPRRRAAEAAIHARECRRCARAAAEFALVRAAVASSGSQLPAAEAERLKAAIMDRIPGPAPA